jgi:hypothetical protein
LVEMPDKTFDETEFEIVGNLGNFTTSQTRHCRSLRTEHDYAVKTFPSVPSFGRSMVSSFLKAIVD